MLNRRHDVREGGQVKHPVDAAEVPTDVRAGDVHLFDRQVRIGLHVRQIQEPARAQVIEHTDAMAVSEQTFDEMAADKTGATSDQYITHRSHRPSCSRSRVEKNTFRDCAVPSVR